MKDSKMFLYHGSSVIVKTPDLNHSRLDIDFGTGFYLTEDEKMAKKWAASKQRAFVNKYEIDLKELNVHVFSLGEEWLSFIKNNRTMNFSSAYEGYDVLIGPTADDKLFDTLREYIDGTMGTIEAVKILNVLGYSDQIVIKSERAIKCLRFLGAKELTGKELDDYRNQMRSDRKKASDKTVELKKQFAREREKRE